MFRKRFNSCLLFVLIVSLWSLAQAGGFRDMGCDGWSAVDALGRSLPTYKEIGPRRDGKLVGMFYYIWHGAHGETVYDITELLKANPDHPQWGPKGAFHFWGQPEYGYYRSDDPWVIRHDMQMLSNAGVDFIFFDVTNAYTYLDTVKQVCEVSMQMRSHGIQTPHVCFLTHSRSGQVMNQLYDEFYAKGLYEELWFRRDGKPLIMGKADDPDLRPEVKNFFTIKFSWAWTNTRQEPNHWQWLDGYPQDWGWSQSPEIAEQITVSTAHHPANPLGKSYFKGKEPPVQKNYTTKFTDRGLQFSEQWKHALKVDPTVVMVTQWNEWIAQRFIWDQGKGQYAGRPIDNGDSYFVDVFTREFNRDIAPMKGGYSDNYYYQLVSNIRRFKGMTPPSLASEPTTIDIDGEFDEWDAVGPVFYDPPGDTQHRNFKGYDPQTVYVNTTGRNDIIESRVARDADNIYFYVKTQQRLTATSDPHWMLLLIDRDKNKKTGWQGYDVIVNHGHIEASKSPVKQWDGASWTDAGNADYAVNDTQLEIKIPRSFFGNQQTRSDFYFHWADNPQHLNDISAFFLDGDAAPDRRFNYHYISR